MHTRFFDVVLHQGFVNIAVSVASIPLNGRFLMKNAAILKEQSALVCDEISVFSEFETRSGLTQGQLWLAWLAMAIAQPVRQATW